MENRFAIYEVWKLCSVTIRGRLPLLPSVPNCLATGLGLVIASMQSAGLNCFLQACRLSELHRQAHKLGAYMGGLLSMVQA